MRFLIRIKLSSVLLIILVSIIAVAALLLSRRSVWIDEAMLLRNIYELTYIDLIYPLKYYDQASPIFSTAIIKFITIFSREHIVITRLLICFFVGLSALLILLKLKKHFGLLSINIFLISSVAATYSVVFFATELKHYAFEIAAGFIFLYWLISYIDTPQQALSTKYVLILALSISLGFSTLLLFIAFCIYVILEILIACKFARIPEFVKKYSKPILILTVTVFVVYLHMKYLTTFQMSNYKETYATKGLLETIEDLESLAVRTYGLQFIFAIVLSSVLAFATPKESLTYKVNLFFLLLIVIVLIMKLLGVYPVRDPRHIVWLTPFGMVIIAMTLHGLLSNNVKSETVIGVFILVLLFSQGIANLYRLQRGDISSYTSNQSLYETLSQQMPSDVLVFHLSEPSLYLYKRIMPNLQKHAYFGLISPLSGFTPPESALMNNFSSIYDKPGVWSSFSVFWGNDAMPIINWQFLQMPNRKNFFLLMSHIDHIDDINAKSFDGYIKALHRILNAYSCSYVSLFKGKKAQLLKISCQN